MNSGSDFLLVLLERFAYQSPFMLLYVIGIIYAMAKIRQARTPAMLMILSLGTMLFSSVIISIVYTYLLTEMLQNGGGMSVKWLLRVTGIVSTLTHAFGIAMLIYAVFVGRNKGPGPDE